MEQNNRSGDNIGGNKLVFQTTNSRHAKLKELFKKYEYEKENNIQLQHIFSDLEHYMSSRDVEIIGLEEKMKRGGRENLIDYAMEVKEFYSKKLVRNQFYESAQKINVYLLALVKTYYMTNIYPQVCKGADEILINQLITDKITNPLLDALEGDTLGFNSEDIQGMLYYLTGNCHIRWNK